MSGSWLWQPFGSYFCLIMLPTSQYCLPLTCVLESSHIPGRDCVGDPLYWHWDPAHRDRTGYPLRRGGAGTATRTATKTTPAGQAGPGPAGQETGPRATKTRAGQTTGTGTGPRRHSRTGAGHRGPPGPGPHVALRDMNLDAPATDGRRIEVVANGLHMWQGPQVSVDTTLVSPLQGDGQPRPRADSAQTPHVP